MKLRSLVQFYSSKPSTLAAASIVRMHQFHCYDESEPFENSLSTSPFIIWRQTKNKTIISHMILLILSRAYFVNCGLFSRIVFFLASSPSLPWPGVTLIIFDHQSTYVGNLSEDWTNLHWKRSQHDRHVLFLSFFPVCFYLSMDASGNLKTLVNFEWFLLPTTG